MREHSVLPSAIPPILRSCSQQQGVLREHAQAEEKRISDICGLKELLKNR
jgi:hypothetical protein